MGCGGFGAVFVGVLVGSSHSWLDACLGGGEWERGGVLGAGFGLGVSGFGIYGVSLQKGASRIGFEVLLGCLGF